MIRYQYKKKLMQKNVYKLFQQKNSKPKPCIIAVCKSSVILTSLKKNLGGAKVTTKMTFFSLLKKLKCIPLFELILESELEKKSSYLQNSL